MDLLSLVRLLRRHLWSLLLVVVFTAAGAVYVVAFVPPVYTSTASYVFINPPPPPTTDEITRDPSLAALQSDNPVLRFSDPRTVVVLVASRINADPSRDALVAAGADDRYEVVPTNRFGIASPILDVNAVAADETTALTTARVVGDAVAQQLRDLQTPSGVDDRFMVTLQVVDFPDSAERQISGTLRMLIAVLVLGMFGLFVTVSVMEALDKKRAERTQARREQLDLLTTPSSLGVALPVDEWDLERLSVGSGDPPPDPEEKGTGGRRRRTGSTSV